MDILDTVSKVKAQTTPIMLVAVGPSGAGKSTLIGSLGVVTLVITRGIETHGADNAAAVNPDIYALKLDRDKEGNTISADDEVRRLYAALNSPKLFEQFKCVAIDGWTEMCRMFAATSAVAKALETSKIPHLDQARLVGECIMTLIEKLKELNEKGMHIITTCAGSITTDPQDSDLYEIKPNLPGHGIGEAVSRCFPDIIGLGKTTIMDEETGEIEAVHKIIFHALVVKRSKNKAGAVTKQSSFSPRLRGKFGKDLPPSMSADLKQLIKFRNEEQK